MASSKQVSSFMQRRGLYTRGAPIIVRRSDFFKVKELPKPRYEQVALLLGMNQGFRMSEARLSEYDHFRLDAGVVYVNDSKDHKLYPLPLDWEVAKEFSRLAQGANKYILKHTVWKTRRDKPVGRKYMWEIVKRWAKDAGVLDWENWTWTFFRRFFAKEWLRSRYKRRENPNYGLLKTLMRHRHVLFTWGYLESIHYLEDIQKEVERFRLPVEELHRDSYEKPVYPS